MPLKDSAGTILGHLAVLDTRPMPEDPTMTAVFRIFAARASAELQRLRAEEEARAQGEKLSRLVNSAMDAVIELDPALHITLMNPAAEKVFQCRAAEAAGEDFTGFLAPESRAKLLALLAQLDARAAGEQYLWVPGVLKAVDASGRTFDAEASLSRYQAHHCTYHALILRNISERLAAEKRMNTLSAETHYLRQELEALRSSSIIGNSPAMRRVLADIQQVARTQATVLIQGETGTGKELIARAIHEQSGRSQKALIKVNCAAIPAALMESEFFGHEKGAFTGATARREGRFALADGGTLFLDEVGDLPVDLQAKLLRVLQEGEFEPVGSAHTRKVDVRIIAATNRTLEEAVREAAFREDLYYRLNVFPITVPPLRERAEDIAALAQAFLERFARQMGRKVTPLTEACIQRLRAYRWPGNVRELENVIERGIITSVDGRVNLDRSLPEPAEARERLAGAPVCIRTAQEMEAMERENILRALEEAQWKIAGEQGAARLLGIPPSTLTSRMKALGITRS